MHDTPDVRIQDHLRILAELLFKNSERARAAHIVCHQLIDVHPDIVSWFHGQLTSFAGDDGLCHGHGWARNRLVCHASRTSLGRPGAETISLKGTHLSLGVYDQLLVCMSPTHAELQSAADPPSVRAEARHEPDGLHFLAQGSTPFVYALSI
jgi:hypothetical protein